NAASSVFEPHKITSGRPEISRNFAATKAFAGTDVSPLTETARSFLSVPSSSDSVLFTRSSRGIKTQLSVSFRNLGERTVKIFSLNDADLSLWELNRRLEYERHAAETVCRYR